MEQPPFPTTLDTVLRTQDNLIDAITTLHTQVAASLHVIETLNKKIDALQNRVEKLEGPAEVTEAFLTPEEFCALAEIVEHMHWGPDEVPALVDHFAHLELEQLEARAILAAHPNRPSIEITISIKEVESDT